MFVYIANSLAVVSCFIKFFITKRLEKLFTFWFLIQVTIDGQLVWLQILTTTTKSEQVKCVQKRKEVGYFVKYWPLANKKQNLNKI